MQTFSYRCEKSSPPSPISFVLVRVNAYAEKLSIQLKLLTIESQYTSKPS